MRLNLQLPDKLMADIKARGGVTESIRECLSRYYYLLAQARAGLSNREAFSAGELSLLTDVCNGTFWEPHTLGCLGANADDAEDDYYEKWGVKRADLLAKLAGLTPLEQAAVVDAIERFWKAVGTGMTVDPRHLLD
jgi:hypothetical protein